MLRVSCSLGIPRKRSANGKCLEMPVDGFVVRHWIDCPGQ